ncbi:MAG TPA: iron-containing redox enzyme family protein [Candidatus Binatia bacterium]|nr:iron-containing redox enzyme family protein [Candidatus Binatia bacterium]
MFAELINGLKAHKRSYIDCNPLFARLTSGDITQFHYLAYLRETYHLVKHTPKYLTIAADRLAAKDERLSAYFRNFSLEETGHELLCIRDIHALGEDVDNILSGDPGPGTWGIVTQCYFWATEGNPVALLGDAFATEELGVASGLDVARLLQANYGIPRQATNFLRVHGSEDKGHLEAAARTIEWYARDPDLYAAIVHATRMTYRYYGQLFTDVLELGDVWSQHGLPVRHSPHIVRDLCTDCS